MWERGLNPEQLTAVRHTRGPLLLLAVAGCGKTLVVCHRVARLVFEEKVPGDRILCVTFSNKAAGEMNSRLAQLGVSTRVLAGETSPARVGTWHSLCLQILTEDATCYASWTIDRGNYAKSILKDVIGFRGLNWQSADVGKLSRFIGTCKANLWDHASLEARQHAVKEFSAAASLALDAFRLFQAAVEAARLLTFDDFLVFVHRHLLVEENRRRWASRWDHVIQDEGQDASRAQVVIARMLAMDHRNYMIVGDPAQGIYSFRGAKPEYLLEFEAEWTATRVVLHRNYRSGRRIVELANAVIRPATCRMPEEMTAARDSDGEVSFRSSEDHEEEGEALAAWIRERSAQGAKLSEFTVLFRLNAQSRAPEEALLRAKIPYTLVGGLSFYDRKEVKDLLGYLRVAARRDRDADALRRCINAPFRKLGKQFVARLMDASKHARAAGDDLDWATVVADVATQEKLWGSQRAAAASWVSLVEEVRALMTTVSVGPDGKPRVASAGKVLLHVLERTNYVAAVEKEDGEETPESSVAANVREMVRVADKFQTVDDLLDYVERTISEARRQRSDGQRGGDRVTLMTVHKAKGLEARRLWIVGANELVFPHPKGDLEEERRIAYVAVTRARDELVISAVRRYATRGGVKKVKPSPFFGAPAVEAA